MYKVPSRKSRKAKIPKPNLIPILDSVFIFIFFLLMSANFNQVFEINSDVPIISDQEPPKDEKPPLALNLKILANQIEVYTGIPGRLVQTFGKKDGEYELKSLRDYLINLKKNNSGEKTLILEPVIDLKYEELVKIMDSVRALKKTEPEIYHKNDQGIDIRVKELFDNIVFGNSQG